MSTHPAQILAIAIALLLLGSAPNVGASAVRVLSFSFDLPDSWIVEGNGGDKLFATGANKMYPPPLVMAEGCVPSGPRQCSGFRRPDPPKELAQFGCSGAAGELVERPDQIIETRWICAPVILDGAKSTAGVSVFEIDGAILAVSYIAGDADVAIPIFLDTLGRSLKVRQ